MTSDSQDKKSRTRLRGLKIVGALAVVGALALHGFYLHLNHSLPNVEGSAPAPGLVAPVDIVRDAYGIPHIYAASKLDAFYAEGYAHAQDRLAQMEFGLMFGEGRLSEFAGEVTLPRDRFMRALDFKGVAERTYAGLPDRTKAQLHAYADGVNAYIDTHEGPWPPEFLVLSVKPERWTPQASIVMTKILALQLAGNLNGELTRATLLEHHTPALLRKLYPDLPGPLPKLAELYPEGDASHTALTRALGGASNNWVVSGAHTKSGLPLLANDPHLGLALPCVWYLAHLSFEDRNVIGASLPGVPGIILGRNDTLAWGYTNSDVDVQDLVIERIDPSQKDHYIAPTGSLPFETRTERFVVHGRPPVDETYLRTRNGPVIPADLPNLAGLVPAGHLLALRWTTLASDDLTVTAGLDAIDATTGAQFVDAMSTWSGPTQNMLYADSQGTIGLYIPGRMPLHGDDNDTLGLLPVPGWNAAYDWKGMVPSNALPQIVNPPDGVIVTANNKIIGPDYPYILGFEWDRGARARRIRALLDASPIHDTASFAAIQMDTVSLEARAALPGLIANLAMHPGQDPRAIEGRIRLSEWDGDMAPDRPEPLLFAAWLREIELGLVGDDLKEQTGAVLGWRFDLIEATIGETPISQSLCDDTSTPDIEDCATIISSAFDRALGELARQYGPRMTAWRWGEPHRAVLANRPLGAVPVIGGMLERTVPSGGGADTVNRGESWFAGNTPFANTHASTYRANYDLAQPQESIFMIAGGQSGNPFSRHYDDLIETWAKGGFIKMTTDRAAVENEFHETLTLKPAPAAP